jgi:hypothetical protein
MPGISLWSPLHLLVHFFLLSTLILELKNTRVKSQSKKDKDKITIELESRGMNTKVAFYI